MGRPGSRRGSNHARSRGADRRYRTIKRIWKIGIVAAGIATSGEKAVVAIAIAVPLFLPVLVKATAMCSSYPMPRRRSSQVSTSRLRPMKIAFGTSRIATVCQRSTMRAALPKKMRKTIVYIPSSESAGKSGAIAANRADPSQCRSPRRVAYPSTIGARRTVRIELIRSPIGTATA